jgi:Tol biopolymer transport system component
MGARVLAFCLCALSVPASVVAQEIVFSRRVYAAQGQSFQQLWAWSFDTGMFRQLTRSARNHDRPSCTAEGTRVLFETTATAPFAPTTHWSFDVSTATEVPIHDQVPPASVPDQERIQQPANCDERTLTTSPDGLRLACTAKGQDIVIFDRPTTREIQRIPFQQRMSSGDTYPSWPLETNWSPDGRRLLVGTYGENGSSTSFQLDYFVLDLATERWSRAFTGSDAVWLPDNATVLFTTPRDLAPLSWSPQRQVWVAHLVRYDLRDATETPLTFGVTNDVQPTLCPALRDQGFAKRRR